MKKYRTVIALMMTIVIMSIPMIIMADNNETEAETVKARVVQNEGIEEREQDNHIIEIQKVKVRIEEGEYENEEYEMEYMLTKYKEDIVSQLELNESDIILIAIEENEGEIANIEYVATVHTNYTPYIAGICILIALFLLGRRHVIPIILYLVTIVMTILILFLAMKKGWDLIWTASIISFLITACITIIANQVNQKTIKMILYTILGSLFAGIFVYVLFDIMGVSNINIKITNSFVNIKELICSIIILYSAGMANAITMSTCYYLEKNTLKYKTKSDNIIEGQRSLKL